MYDDFEMKFNQAAFDDFCQDPVCDAAMTALFREHRDQFDAKAREFTRHVGLWFRKYVFIWVDKFIAVRYADMMS